MRAGRERGAALAEFAVTSALVMLLILGVFDCCRAYFAYDLVSHAARLGTRYAIVNASPCRASGDTSACETAITQYIRANVSGLDATKVTPSFTWQGAPACSGTANPGCAITIQIAYTFTFAALPLASLPLTSSSQMIISQ